MSVVVVLEQTGGQLHRMSVEALACGQRIGQELGMPVRAALLGANLAFVADHVAAYDLQHVHAMEHSLLEEYTPDGYAAALEHLVRKLSPRFVLFPHTYQVRDFAPCLATRFGQVLISDVVEVDLRADPMTVRRQLFQGKLNADIQCGGPGPYFISVQAGSFSTDQLIPADAAAPVEFMTVELEPSQIRTKPEAPFHEEGRAVDLTSAEIIVAVGRGIREQENIHIAEELAAALGGELAASRPICDNGWLPMDRQVGSSGQTVAPKLYIAVGISGAIQHLVGMKAAKNIVAINKDPEAPIFEIADYAAVGDLFEIVPALTEQIRKLRS